MRVDKSLDVPAEIANHDFRIDIGGPDYKQPYSASVFNISAMSFGALWANAILALNAGAKKAKFYHDTGEGSISCHHRQNGDDLVWEIGSGYFGCRNQTRQRCCAIATMSTRSHANPFFIVRVIIGTAYSINCCRKQFRLRPQWRTR